MSENDEKTTVSLKQVMEDYIRGNMNITKVVYEIFKRMDELENRLEKCESAELLIGLKK